MTRAERVQWIAASDGPPWTHVVGNRAKTEGAAEEMRRDGFTGVRVEEFELIEVEKPRVKQRAV